MTEAYQGPTPPPELVTEWWNKCTATSDNLIGQFATHAARWGYQQAVEELEAFVKKGEDKQ